MMDSPADPAPTRTQSVLGKAQEALQARPRISIRTRLTAGVVAWFVLSVGLSIVSIVTINRIEDKIRFTEAVDNYTVEIQQARRFEKNYFLYGTDLDDALIHVRQAGALLDRELEHIRTVIGDAGVSTMKAHLDRYEGLLIRLQELRRQDRPVTGPEHDAIEAGLREIGAEMFVEAQELVRREREAVHRMLAISRRIPVAFIVVLAGLVTYLALMYSRQVLAPLGRMTRTARRIAHGDFTPITPVRKYHDEFSELAVAMNHMMSQLEHRQDLLVKAHKLKAVGTLTAGVAHELNNPINNIMLTAASLEEDEDDLSEEDRAEMIRDLVTESERAQRIVRNLLDFARESSIETEVLDPEELVEQTLQLAANQIKLAKVKVKGEMADNLPAIRGDFQQLTQVFLNIVLNALDAMPGGGVLAISIHTTRDRDFVAFEFTDTGTGMPDHVLENIFDPFFTTKTGAKGTGLGLSVSLGMVRKHGGDIRVRTEAGKGTTFTILLPVAKVPAAMPEANGYDADDLPARAGP